MKTTSVGDSVSQSADAVFHGPSLLSRPNLIWRHTFPPAINSIQNPQFFFRISPRRLSSIFSVSFRLPPLTSSQPLPPRLSLSLSLSTVQIAEDMAAPPATADLCDAHANLLNSGELRVLPDIFKSYGRRTSYSGTVVTVKVLEDNVLVRELLENGAGAGASAREGKEAVLVVDGGGSKRCALLGGNLAAVAADKGWAGLVVYGCVRDVDEIDACHVGVRALGSCPVKSGKKGVGEKHAAVHVGGVVVHDGDWLCADSDGIVVSSSELSSPLE